VGVLSDCALFGCSLHELVEHDKNGLVFNTESELEQQLEVISFYCSVFLGL